MSNLTLIYAHLATIVPAAFIGAYLLLRQKGTPGHRLLGKIYMLLMMITAVITLFITAEVGPPFSIILDLSTCSAYWYSTASPQLISPPEHTT